MQAANYLNETNVRGAKRKEIIDQVAATIILESFLARRKNEKMQVQKEKSDIE